MPVVLSKILIFVMTLFVSLSVFAREGFSTDPSKLPTAVRQAWQSVFFIIPTVRAAIGSAFVIREEYPPELPGKKVLYFLTSDHVVSKICGQQTGVCSNFVMTGSYGLNMDPLEYVKVNDDGHNIKSEISVVRRNAQADLSLVRAVVDAEEFRNIRPIPFDEDCQVSFGDNVFLIGFPTTFDRTTSTALPIENKNLTIRRWSKGYVLFPFESTDSEDGSTHFWTTTTADAIQGTSGGPAINSEGEFWSVTNLVKTTSSSGYTGNEDNAPESFHSAMTRCELVRDFIRGNELPFLETLNAVKSIQNGENEESLR